VNLSCKKADEGIVAPAVAKSSPHTAYGQAGPTGQKQGNPPPLTSEQLWESQCQDRSHSIKKQYHWHKRF